MPRRVPTHKPRHTALSHPAAYRRLPMRREDNRFYASTAWRKLRRAYLNEHPTCEECDTKGLTVLATEVHHIKERKDFPDLALDWDNLQALCHPCHLAKRKRCAD